MELGFYVGEAGNKKHIQLTQDGDSPREKSTARTGRQGEKTHQEMTLKGRFLEEHCRQRKQTFQAFRQKDAQVHPIS